VPFVLRTATGGARMQEGMAALVQMPKVVAARFGLAESHVPFVVVLGDPTTGGVLASLAALADVTIAEAGATIGFAGPRVVEMMTGTAPGASSHSAATALGNGLVDEVIDTEDVRATLEHVLGILRPNDPEPVNEPPRGGRTSGTDGWAAVQTARAAERADAPTLLRAICRDNFALRGDRAGDDDPSLVVAIGRLLGRRVLVMATDRAELLGPAAYRLARRALRVAERLQLPVVTLIDTRGADPSEESEGGGIASGIAQLFAAMLVTEVPIVACVTGEGGSGGALAFATGDVLLAYEDAIFSVIGPEAAATILWRDGSRADEAARALRLTAADLHAFGIADVLLPGPPEATSLANALAYHLDRIEATSGHDLVVARANRWRNRDGHGQASS
ncbi:MAG: acetyl-CoA carboxylase carboxyl transferase subunit beta, partial [Actinomycetota bacterium]|nr:acetyl-CoA carboxylase carboxyl transferase subunit beta [Actinomycetota bacterium]